MADRQKALEETLRAESEAYAATQKGSTKPCWHLGALQHSHGDGKLSLT